MLGDIVAMLGEQCVTSLVQPEILDHFLPSLSGFLHRFVFLLLLLDEPMDEPFPLVHGHH